MDDTMMARHFLALKLGMTVSELEDRVSSEEFGRWQVYFRRTEQRRG